MNTPAHAKREKVSAATMLLLLITVAGLDLAQPESSVAPYYNNRSVNYPVELVLAGEQVTLAPAARVSKFNFGINCIQDQFTSSNSWIAGYRVPLLVSPVTAKLITRPRHFSRPRFMDFNVPHQNSDDG